MGCVRDPKNVWRHESWVMDDIHPFTFDIPCPWHFWSRVFDNWLIHPSHWSCCDFPWLMLAHLPSFLNFVISLSLWEVSKNAQILSNILTWINYLKSLIFPTRSKVFFKNSVKKQKFIKKGNCNTKQNLSTFLKTTLNSFQQLSLKSYLQRVGVIIWKENERLSFSLCAWII